VGLSDAERSKGGMSETHRARQILRRIDAVLAGLLATIVALNSCTVVWGVDLKWKFL
jgi:hypothetical protein